MLKNSEQNENEIKDYKVYLHINKINNKKYIGITKQELKKRWGINGSGYAGSTYFYYSILKYGWDSFEHILLLNNLTESEAVAKEKELIKEYRSNDKKYGYNTSSGGYGISNPIFLNKKKYCITPQIMLKNIRLSKGISMNELQRLSDVHKSTISRIESGELYPTIIVLCKLCNGKYNTVVFHNIYIKNLLVNIHKGNH